MDEKIAEKSRQGQKHWWGSCIGPVARICRMYGGFVRIIFIGTLHRNIFVIRMRVNRPMTCIFILFVGGF